jgi:hypothetical protein
LMGVLFYGTSAANGFDADGHYVRAEPMVGSCTAYVKVPVQGCSANWAGKSKAAAAAVTMPVIDRLAARAAASTRTEPPSALHGLLGYLFGSGS